MPVTVGRVEPSIIARNPWLRSEFVCSDVDPSGCLQFYAPPRGKSRDHLPFGRACLMIASM